MTSLIAQQQELITQVLEHTNKIDTIVNQNVIIVPDIIHETKMIREKVLKIVEMEQLILLDVVFPIG